jgi:hypothetical protein
MLQALTSMIKFAGTLTVAFIIALVVQIVAFPVFGQQATVAQAIWERIGTGMTQAVLGLGYGG